MNGKLVPGLFILKMGSSKHDILLKPVQLQEPVPTLPLCVLNSTIASKKKEEEKEVYLKLAVYVCAIYIYIGAFQCN